MVVSVNIFGEVNCQGKTRERSLGAVGLHATQGFGTFGNLFILGRLAGQFSIDFLFMCIVIVYNL